jgi:hypothetical protein
MNMNMNLSMNMHMGVNSRNTDKSRRLTAGIATDSGDVSSVCEYNYMSRSGSWTRYSHTYLSDMINSTTTITTDSTAQELMI